MALDKICKSCGSMMKEIRTEEVAGTVYHYLKCGNCKKEIVRREE